MGLCLEYRRCRLFNFNLRRLNLVTPVGIGLVGIIDQRANVPAVALAPYDTAPLLVYEFAIRLWASPTFPAFRICPLAPDRAAFFVAKFLYRPQPLANHRSRPQLLPSSIERAASASARLIGSGRSSGAFDSPPPGPFSNCISQSGSGSLLLLVTPLLIFFVLSFSYL